MRLQFDAPMGIRALCESPTFGILGCVALWRTALQSGCEISKSASILFIPSAVRWPIRRTFDWIQLARE
jgi:hypothetical protein